MQFSVFPVIEHPGFGGTIVQVAPLNDGSGSLRTTPVAVPVPVADELVTVTVKPAVCPGLMGEASRVFAMVSAGHRTVVDALAVRVGAFVEVTVAVLAYVLQLAKAVGLWTWTLND